MNATTGVRPGSRRVPGGSGRDYAYVGLVRLAAAVLVDCGHQHRNRDWPPDSATDCAREIIRGARDADYAARVAARRGRAWESLTRSAGHTFTASTITAAKATSAADAVAYLAAVDTVRTATATLF